MKPERWQQIEQLLQAALERKGEARAAFLDQACAGDEALRKQVESLLAYAERAEHFIEAPALEVAAKALAESPATMLFGQKIGHYQILSWLGAGGMSEVYLAQDTRLGRRVALKLLPARFTKHEDRVRRFEQEARAASALNHPNIITIYEIGQVDEAHYIATEFIEGRTLRQRMKHTRMRLHEVLEVAAQVASALQAAHAAGIVHRDIKPENIMVRPDGLVKVLDFGIAKLTEPSHHQSAIAHDAPTIARVETAPGAVMGTARYMSPEQARGLEVDGRSDLFSLGVVMYEMIAGRAPFAGPTPADVSASILGQEPAPLASYISGVPEALEWIVTKSLRKDREERYQTARDLLTDLKGLKQRLEIQAELARARSSASDGAEIEPGNRQTTVETAANTAVEEIARTTSSVGYLLSQLRRHQGRVVAALMVLVMVAAAIAYFTRESQQETIASIAVLPFVNESPDPDTEHLSDGITESIRNSLSQLPHLKVISHLPVSRYQGRVTDARMAGQALKVQAVVMGRISKRGDNLSVSAELVDTRDSRQLWGDQFNRKLANILALQDEISREISAKLRMRLSGEERKRLTKRYTENTEAHLAYLKGRYIWSKRQREDYGQAIAYFQQAIAKDPTFALAWAGLADCYVLGGGGRSGRETHLKAKAAAMEALKIDETLAEAHATLGLSQLFHDWNLTAAEAEFKRALELDPNYATARQWYADYLAVMGRTEEALAQIKQARELEPLSEILIRDTGRIFYYARRYDEALAQCQTALEMKAKFYPAIVTLGDIYLQQKRYGEAVAHYQQAVKLAPGMAMMKASLAHAYAASGQRGEAQKILAELIAQVKGRPVPAFDLAVIYAGLGERERAFQQLEQAYQERFYRLIYLGVEPLFDSLRRDPRFQDLLRRVGLAPLPGGQSGSAGRARQGGIRIPADVADETLAITEDITEN
jgi:serine/threonine-protein kinase